MDRKGRSVLTGPSFFWWTSKATKIWEAWQVSPEEFAVDPLAPQLTYEHLVERVDIGRACSKGYATLSHQDGRRDVCVFLRLDGRYDVMGQYNVARASNQVGGTVHGQFWRIRPGDVRMAAQFWTRFGPLEHQIVHDWPDDPEIEYVWFSLADFWRKHRRFVSVTKLWTTLDDIVELRKSWLELHSHLKEINKAEFFPFGKMPKADYPSQGLSSYGSVPWEEPGINSSDWLSTSDDATLREITVGLLEMELKAQLRKTQRWLSVWEYGRPTFEPILATSLWTAMWHLFAMDTRSRGWRICPHCGKLFYPPREDRRYCTSKLQVYYSKQQWWDKHKQEELAKRRVERRQQRKLETDTPRGDRWLFSGVARLGGMSSYLLGSASGNPLGAGPKPWPSLRSVHDEGS